MRRQLRIADSGARPSRRKNEPGIFPAAYMRSSMSTVRGKKSMPSRTPVAALAVTRTMVLPRRPTTAPWDCVASFPVSNVSCLSLPLTGADTEMASAMVLLSPAQAGGSGGGGASCQSAGTPANPSARRLAADRPPRRSCAALLAAQPEPGDQGAVPLDVVGLHVVEQPPAPTHQHEQAAAAVVVLLVHLQ